MTEEIPWKPYNPSLLIELAKEQHSEIEWLIEALTLCTSCRQEREAYIYFVNRSEWQVETNVTLYSQTEGLIVLDILKDHRVGGVEFYEKLNKGPGLTCTCGFIHNYLSVQGHSWITVHDTQYKNLQEIEEQVTDLSNKIDKQVRQLLRKAKSDLVGRIYQCPECGRIMWRKPGEKEYQIFLPENAG